jgi:ribonuclease R
LKEFLLKLIKGLKKDTILKSNQDLLDKLLLKGIIKLNRDIYRVNSRYRFGTVDISKSGSGYLEVIDSKKCKDLFIKSHNLTGATKGDIVVAKRIFSKGRPEAKVIQILQKDLLTSVVYLKKIDQKIVGLNIQNDLPTHIASSQKSLKKLPPNTLLKIDNTTNVVLEVLGTVDDPKVDEKISLAIYNKEENFSQKTLNEAYSYGDSVDKSMYPNRVDLTHLDFCTIDPVDAKDFDDAIYYDKTTSTLYIAIADVSEYVSYNSNLDKEALKRGFSIYFPHKVIPMLPKPLSENICSLKPLVDRLAYICEIKLDLDSLEVVKSDLYEAIINSKRRYTYERVDEFLDGRLDDIDNIDQRILKSIIPLQKLLSKIRYQRLKNGCDFQSSEVSIKLDQNENIIATHSSSETPSHALIEDAMLLANKEAAKLMQRGVFRVHQEPDRQKIEDLLNTLATIGISSNSSNNLYSMFQNIQSSADRLKLRSQVDRLIIQSQQQARYTTSNFGHFGLGFESYTHFTSPIRRYSDLIAHRVLKANMQGRKKELEFILSSLELVSEQVNKLERESSKVAWDYIDRKYARWAKKNIGTKIEAIVVDIDRTPIAISDSANILGMRVFLRSSDLELFQRVEIEIEEVYITTKRVIGSVTQRFV